MSHFFIKFAFFIFLPGLVSASTLFIGNSGEVYRRGTAYFVRDLVETNTHINPYFHCYTDKSSLLPISSSLFPSMNVDMDLLKRKLCDVDLIYPGMGTYFIQAFHMHSWTLVDTMLNLLPDDGPLLVSKDFERMQAANRTLSNIRVQTHIWKQLDKKNKVALLLHEIISSLLKYECVDTSCTVFQQRSRIAREITGLLFSEATYTSPKLAEKLRSLMRDYLTPESSDLVGTDSNEIKVSFGEDFIAIKKLESLSVHDYANTVCRRFIQLKQLDPSLRMRLFVANIPKPLLTQAPYQTIYGREYGLKITKTDFYISKKISDVQDEKSCTEELNNAILESRNCPPSGCN